MQREPEFIYFDLGNVLVHFDHEIGCRQMAEVAGVSVDLVREIVFESGLEDRYERGELSTREFYDHFCEATGALPDFDALVAAAGAIFRMNLEMIPLVAHLRTVFPRLGVLSNTCEAHWDYCVHEFTLVREFFPVRALSYQLRAAKPDPEIYQMAAELAGCRPDAIFFTDDRPENVQGALEAGFDAIPFTNAHELAQNLRDRGLRFNY